MDDGEMIQNLCSSLLAWDETIKKWISKDDVTPKLKK